MLEGGNQTREKDYTQNGRDESFCTVDPGSVLSTRSKRENPSILSCFIVMSDLKPHFVMLGICT